MATLTVYFVTFNCARSLIDANDFAAHFFGPDFDDADSLPDVIVLSLQEIAPIAYSFLGGQYLAPYLSRFAQAVNLAARPATRYQNLITRNLGMTTIQVLAKPEVAADVRFMEAAGVGVGDWGLGNKGAVGVRIGFSRFGSGDDSSSLTLIAAHLAPMEDGWQRRNEDWRNIVRGMGFLPVRVKSGKTANAEVDAETEGEPLLSSATDAELSGFESSDARSIFVPRSPVIFGGVTETDLNYRTGDTGPLRDAHHDFPQPTGNDITHAIGTFLKKDQLKRERDENRTLHQLDEMPIQFPPTYKYSIPQNQPWPKDGSEPHSWHWAKHRLPSWCDRILFSSYLQNIQNLFRGESYRALPLQPTSDHRPVCLLFQINLQSLASTGESSVSQSTPPFTLNARWAEDREAARRKELVVGLLSYLSLTWEGNGSILASIVGAVGGWYIIRSMVSS